MFQVYVLDDDRKLAMVMGARPNELEASILNITRYVRILFRPLFYNSCKENT